MGTKYDWITELKAELDKLDESQPDYEQVALLKKLDKMWDVSVPPMIKEMTSDNSQYYIAKMKNEITYAIRDYLAEYICQDSILSKCMSVSAAGITNGRKRIYLDVEREVQSVLKPYKLRKLIEEIDYRSIMTELTGTDRINDLWATKSLYQAFQKGWQFHPDWVERYCVDIIHSLSLISVELKKRVDEFIVFGSKSITLEQIAPCGLICSVCEHAIYDDPPCPGCRGEGEGKIEFCKSVCRIPKCEKRLKHDWSFCDKCPDYPCEEITEKQVRYTTKYLLMENPMGLLGKFKSEGTVKTLKNLEEEWICPECGEFICVHTGTCKNNCKRTK